MVNFNKCLFIIKYCFSQCLEIMSLRIKPKDEKDCNHYKNDDENKYKSISEYDINEDDINNFVMIDTMIR